MMGGAMLFTAAVVITISVYEKRKRHLPTRDPFHLLAHFPRIRQNENSRRKTFFFFSRLTPLCCSGNNSRCTSHNERLMK